MKLVIPSAFLLVLGIGNIAVGYYKQAQYDTVVQELSQATFIPDEVRATPLMRIQVSKPATARLYQRQQKAAGRRDFYRLVVLGGKLLLGLSFILLFWAWILTPARDERSELRA